MQRSIGRVEELLTRRRWLVIGVWGVLVLASLPFAAQENSHLSGGGFGSPRSQSQNVQDVAGRFRGVTVSPMAVVLSSRAGSTSAVRSEIARVAAAVRTIPRLGLSPNAQAIANARAGNPILVIPLKVNGTADQSINSAKELRTKLDVGVARDGVVPHLIGEQALWAALEDVSKQDLEKAESTGFPAVLIVLLAVVGSLAAAMLPLGLGFASVAITGALIYFLSQQLEMSIFVSNIASLLGIGVAVDYSLFILWRYRDEVAGGASPELARRTAMQTSGLAVVFSGMTVLVALAGLFLIDSQTMRSMAIGALLVVAVSVLAAVTLLPALITMLGPRAYERGRYVGLVKDRLRAAWRGLAGRTGKPRTAARSFWERWTATVMRRPALFASGAAALMLMIAIPALSLKWGTAALRQLPPRDDTRVGVEQAGRVLGPGALDPALVVLTFHRGTESTPSNRQATHAYSVALERLPGVASVAPVIRSPTGSRVLISVTPSMASESPQGTALISRLRAPTGVSSQISRVAKVEVGGSEAINVDFAHLVSTSLWKIFLFVMIVTYLVLLILLRSVVLPLKAVAMNLLTVAAAYGVLVTVFQYGWFDGVLSYHALGYINGTTPPLVLTIVFGLSMDYEVFLLTRIRERYEATGETTSAVAQGLASSARVITSAAVIMVLVFAVFALVGLPSVKEIGVGLAVAIALDATIVRLVLVPTTMALMGRLNWWLPRWLDRILPHTDFESSPVQATTPAALEPTKPGGIARVG